MARRGGVSYAAFRRPARSALFINQIPTSGSAPVFPLDGLSPSFAVATTRLLTAYTGPWARVREAGINSEADLGFDASGWFSDNSPCSNLSGTPPGGAGNNTPYGVWRGATGNHNTLRWLYDQSGNAAHMGQASAGNQSSVFNGAVFYTMGSGSRRAWSSNDSGNFGNMSMLTGATVKVSNSGTDATFVAVLNPVSNGNFYSWKFSAANNGLRGPIDPGDLAQAEFEGITTGAITPIKGTGPKMIVARRQGANGVTRVNGAVHSTSTTMSGTMTTALDTLNNLGMFANTPDFLRYSLFAWFPYALTDAEITTLESRISALGLL